MVGDIFGVGILVLIVIGAVSMYLAMRGCIELAAMRERRHFDD